MGDPEEEQQKQLLLQQQKEFIQIFKRIGMRHYLFRIKRAGVSTFPMMEEKFEDLADFVEFLGGEKHARAGYTMWEAMNDALSSS